MWFQRAINPYLHELSAHFPAVVVTGARQTGKTALLRQAFPEAEFVSLDVPSVAESADLDPSALLASAGDRVLHLDEVQYAPGLFRHLKVAIERDRHRMGRYVMTGSQKFQLVSGVADSLAGRCAVLELGPLSSAELRGTLQEATPPLADRIVRGGFPELWRDRTLNHRAFFSSYLATYLERDVRSLARVGQLRDFERFLRALAVRTGGLLNLSDLGRHVGIAATTARDWLSIVETSGVAVLVEPWFGNVGKRLIKAPKVYLRDTGLACFLLAIDTPEQLVRSPQLGALFETWVLAQLHCRIASTGSAAKLYFYRDAHGTEVDFAFERGGRVHLVEVKWAEDVRAARFVSAIEKVAATLGPLDGEQHWLVCRTPTPHPLRTQANVRAIGEWDLDALVV